MKISTRLIKACASSTNCTMGNLATQHTYIQSILNLPRFISFLLYKSLAEDGNLMRYLWWWCWKPLPEWRTMVLNHWLCFLLLDFKKWLMLLIVKIFCQIKTFKYIWFSLFNHENSDDLSRLIITWFLVVIFIMSIPAVSFLTSSSNT
jgi:hypothetical protein